MSRNDLYLPTNPHYIVKQVIPESATPMQSAAKVPILVAFEVRPPDAASANAQDAGSYFQTNEAPQNMACLAEEQVCETHQCHAPPAQERTRPSSIATTVSSEATCSA